MLRFNFVTFKKLQKSAHAFEAEDFLNIFVRFWGFRGSFSYKNFSYKKTRIPFLSYSDT